MSSAPNQSQLPEWMRSPQQNERVTVLWRLKRAFTTNPIWRAVADAWWRLQSRNRLSQRYPKTFAIGSTLLTFLAASGLYYVIVVVLPNVR